MSSSNGGINSATNGRSGSTGSANINLMSGVAGGGGGGGGGAAAAASASASKILPDLKTQRSNSGGAGAGVGGGVSALALTHRRDNSHVDCPKVEKTYTYAPPQSKLMTRNDQDGYLVYCDGKLHSGSLQSLISHMVPSHEYYPDEAYVFAFILSARLFIRPHELLEKISQTWEQQQQTATAEAAIGGSGGADVVDDAGQGPQGCHNIHLTINSASPMTHRKGTTATTTTTTNLDPKPQQRTCTQKSAQHCIRLLSEWIEIFPYDFRDERLMQQVRILARKCVYIDNSLGKQVSRILQLLVSRLTALEKYEEFLQQLGKQQEEQVPPTHNHHQQLQHHHHHHHNPFQTFLGSSSSSSSNGNSLAGGNATGGPSSGLLNAGHSNSSSGNNSSNSASTTPQPTDDVFGIMDICPSCAYLAHQLTAIELERLSHIGPEEFVQAFAKDAGGNGGGGGNGGTAGTTSSLNDMKKTRNLESYVQWFNRLSYLTASEIVKYPKKKQRVRIIEYWIETARECFNIGNFNSLMAIIAGLNLAPIGRLKKTWSKVQSAKFSVLEHQMDPTSNFNSYRSTLKAAMWRSEGATEERERIIIPFFSLFVKDLYFLNEGCSNRLPNNHINFEKCSQLAKQVMEFNEWKKVSCPFEKLPHVLTYLQHQAVLNENTLAMASFECEPPENTEEKDRYKTVKAETKQQLLQQLQ
ncbi:uncharacterized protein Dwil_GK20533, partial [Drosophila willistoni]